MSIHKFNVEHLLVNGVRIIPKKLIIDYRYIRDDITTETQGYVTACATLYDKNPDIICYFDEIYLPTDTEMGMSKFATEILNLKDKFATGIYFEIHNAEYMQIDRVSIAYETAEILQGHDATSLDVLRVLSMIIDDGEIFSLNSPVTLNTTCNKVVTHYKASKFSDFRDAVWKTYEAAVLFDLFTIGINRIYFKIKNATEESASVYDEVGWHGQIWIDASEEVVIGSVIFEEDVTVEQITPYNLTINEDIDLSELVVITDPDPDTNPATVELTGE